MEPEMELMAIVITVCALANPDHCEEQRLEFSSQFSLKTVRDERSAVSGAMDWRTSQVDHQELSLRVSAFEERLMRPEQASNVMHSSAKIGVRPVVMGILNLTRTPSRTAISS